MRTLKIKGLKLVGTCMVTGCMALISGSLWAAPSRPADGPISYLTTLRGENTTLLREVEGALQKGQTSEEAHLLALKEQKKELECRQSFLNRLILQFDTKFKGGDTQDFLRVTLREMSEVEVQSDSAKTPMWKFLDYLAMSLDALPKGQMNVLKFVEGYMKSSPFSKPIEPKKYLSRLDYYNEVQTQSAHGMSPSEAAELLESRDPSSSAYSL